MTCVAAIEVDLDVSPIGTRSCIGHLVNGDSALTHTIRNVARAACLDSITLLAPENQISECEKHIPPSLARRVSVQANKVTGTPYRSLIQTARKWALDSWRGGLGGMTFMDEYTRTGELAMLGHGVKAEWVFCVNGGGPLVDPAMIDTMFDHAMRTEEEARLTFAQAPPGLVGTVYRTDLLIELGQHHMPPGFVLSYKPDHPQMDLANKSTCYTASVPIRRASGRLIADTRRSLETIRAYYETGGPVDADSVARWLIDRDRRVPSSLPRETELELSTDTQLPDALLRPCGDRLGRTGCLDVGIVERIARELGAYDDSLVMLGGFGEPLLHPRFGEILGILRDTGIYGIAVRTNGLALNDAIIDLLIEHKVDVLNVVLDAWTPETYARVQGVDRLDEVKQNLTRLEKRKQERKSVSPLVVPELTKSLHTMDDMDAFFDGWIRTSGWANMGTGGHYAGQVEDLRPMPMSPPSRTPCRQMMRRSLVLADGRVTVCDQDFKGRYTVGDVSGGDMSGSSLSDIWRGSAMEKARSQQIEGHCDSIPLCTSCDEWHRL